MDTLNDAWNPKQYERFKDERAQPFYDLLGLVEEKPGLTAIDLGCGTGELTRVLHSRLRASATLGVDSSDAMLGKAKAFEGSGLSFRKLAIESMPEAGAFDLIFSNAAIHWVNDHPSLLRAISKQLKPGGQLAVQIPANHDHASHRVATEVACEAPFKDALQGYTRQSPVLAPAHYSELLYDLGFSKQRVSLQVYLHVLPSAEGVIEWVKGTLLTDYESRLSPELYAKFLGRYRERLLNELGDRAPYPYAFKRILFWGSLS